LSSGVRRLLESPFFFGLVLLGGAAGSLLVADGINRPPGNADLGYARVDTTRRNHVLILLVDSWRHETALDSSIMPTVALLNSRGASGKIETVFEGFSVPAIRAEFSGTAPTQLVNLIRNFHFRALPIESAFLDASRIGKRSLVVGDEPFTQFGPFLEKRLPDAPALDMYGRDRLRPAIALDAYRTGSWDLVVCHYETADWRAHELGIHAPAYVETFAYVDSIIAEFARSRRPGDYLLVFGDHGHNERGEHKTGLYIPTHGLFIGPDIRPGVVFPSLDASDVRFVVDHALGIELRVSERELQRFSRFLPTASAQSVATVGTAAAPVAGPHPSRAAGEYLLFALFLAVYAGVTRAAASGDRLRVVSPAFAAVCALFLAELLAQQVLNPQWSVFPFVMLAVGVLAWRVERWRGALVTAIAIFFLTRFSLGSGAGALVRAPAGILQLVPLYVAGSCAKLGILLGVAGRRRWLAAALVTALLALLEYRLWDAPGVFLAAIAIAAVGLRVYRTGVHRRLALVALGYAILYFTLRLPIYQYAWVDLFVLAVCVAVRAVPGAWLDALVISGAFALTSVWLPSGLEWGFLYGLVPAYIVELQVGWFVPFILLKLPLLLALTFWASDSRPTRRFVVLMFLYAGIRFAGTWTVRLMGGSGAQTWPMAEQGIYLTMFAIATVWMYRAPRRSGEHAQGVHIAHTSSL
jgi:hypothetical protein